MTEEKFIRNTLAGYEGGIFKVIDSTYEMNSIKYSLELLAYMQNNNDSIYLDLSKK